MMNDQVEPSFSESSLSDFKRNNPHCAIQYEAGTINIEAPWGVSDARIKFSIEEDGFLSDLNRIQFDTRFDAVFHLDTNCIEFLFAYVRLNGDNGEGFINREFDFYFEGRRYSCKFAEPSARLLRIALHFERLASDVAEKSVPQLLAFKDAQQLESLSERNRKFFEGRVPRNFFLSTAGGFAGVNIESLTRHLNFLMHYYDRDSPVVVIRESPFTIASSEYQPIRLIEGAFPNALATPVPVDDIVLRLLGVARYGAPRASFIYYYQVFEYAGYYYIDEKSKSLLRNALRDPALICCGEDKVSEIFGIFSDIAQSDEAKMRKVIEDHCDPRAIWKEVLNDHEFFSAPQSFDGGFCTTQLISKDVSEGTWKAMWMPKTFDLLTKIRNVLVHAREKRESKVILPTRKNNAILARYIPVIKRVAEQLAIKS